jgi:hypothetical protein
VQSRLATSNQKPSFGQNIDRGPQYQRVAKNPNQLVLSREKLPKSHANLSRPREMCSAERKPNLAQAISTKTQRQRNDLARPSVSDSSKRSRARVTKLSDRGVESCKVPLRRWRGGFIWSLAIFSRRQSCELTRIFHVRTRELAMESTCYCSVNTWTLLAYALRLPQWKNCGSVGNGIGSRFACEVLFTGSCSSRNLRNCRAVRLELVC